MPKFLKSLSGIVIGAVTILGVLTLFFEALNSPLISLIALMILLISGFIFLIIYYFMKIEKKMQSIEQKFKRADDLIDIKADIKDLQRAILKNGK